MPYISTRDLSALLGLSEKAMDRWPEKHKPRITGKIMHSYDAVNAWLAEPGRARGFASPPTIEQMVAGEVIFILREFATPLLTDGRDMLDKKSYTWRNIINGRLEALLVRPRLWTVTLRSVHRLIEERENEKKDFTVPEACHILGIGPNGSFYRLVRDEVLVALRNKHGLERTRITRSSLVALLERLLPAGRFITPDGWIEERLTGQEPLLTSVQVAPMLGLVPRDVRDLLKAGELLYIKTPDSPKNLILAESVRAYQERQPCLTTAQKMRVFGTDNRQNVSAWMLQERLFCPLHTHGRPGELHRWCMVAFIDRLCEPHGVEAVRWVRRMLSATPPPLWVAQTVYNRRVLGEKKLQGLVRRGRIPSIRGPGGIRVYDAWAVMREEKRAG